MFTDRIKYSLKSWLLDLALQEKLTLCHVRNLSQQNSKRLAPLNQRAFVPACWHTAQCHGHMAQEDHRELKSTAQPVWQCPRSETWKQRKEKEHSSGDHTPARNPSVAPTACGVTFRILHGASKDTYERVPMYLSSLPTGSLQVYHVLD